jgi:sterol 3beta-glucosyltransferase
MKVTVIAIGTRGDVQPLIALGVQLAQCGHTVRIAAQSLFASVIADARLEFYPLSGDARKFFAGAVGRHLRTRMDDGDEFTRFWKSYVSPVVRRHVGEVIPACLGADAIVCEPWFQIAPTLKDYLNIPCFVGCVMPVPCIQTQEFNYPFSQQLCQTTAETGCAESWRDAEWFGGVAFPEIKMWRASLGLKSLEWNSYLEQIRGCPHLFGYSVHVLKKPSDWSELHQVTGYWFLSEGEHFVPPQRLKDFLETGSPPVVLGFSSQVCEQVERVRSCFIQSLRKTRKRGIILSGWDDNIQIDTGECLSCKEVPYDWLLPQVAGMVHHGGAGSVGECLRAGIPSLAIPQGYDGAFWGLRIAELGLGLKPVRLEAMEVRDLTYGISRFYEDRELCHKLGSIAGLISEETNQFTAVHLIENYVAEHG